MGLRGVVVMASGGIDSTTLVYQLKDQGYHRLHLLGFDYGQRHRKELVYAQIIAKRLDADFDIIDLTSMTHLLKGSALTDNSVEVPNGHYTDDSIKATVVPNRNAVMLTIAYSVAIAGGARGVAIGVHAGDHPVYADCRPEFISAFGHMQQVVDNKVWLYAPFVLWTKAEIVQKGTKLGVPYDMTWSCYKGGEVHCGVCGTCTERQEAFEVAGVKDPTEYKGGHGDA